MTMITSNVRSSRLRRWFERRMVACLALATLALLCFVTLSVLVVAAQQTQPNAPPAPPAQGTQPPQPIRATTTLIVEEVEVKDKSGKAVEGLTTNDFVLTEDGVPQTISFVEFQRLEAAAPSAEPAPAAGPVVPTAQRATQAQIAPEVPGDTRYRDHRLLALYFDMSTMQPADQLRAFDAALKFIDTQMDSSVLMAVMTFDSGGAVKVKQDFTGDRAQIRAAMDKLIVGLSQGFDETTTDDSAADTGAAFGQDDAEFNIFNTDRQLAALQTAVQMLGTLNEQKALIYFASGLRLNGTDNQAQLVATTNAALRANVLLDPIDARGLVAEAPLGNATTGSNGGIGMFSGTSALAMTTNFQRSQDTLYALAKDTGGKAMFDFNDLSLGIKQAAEAMSSYYEIGYYPTHTALDGRFHRIKISLKEGLSANLAYRQGYYAGKEFSKFSTADKERQLEEALALGDPVTDINIAMEVNYFQLNGAEYFVPVAVKIPGRELALARRGGASETLIDFIGEVKDDFGNTIQNLRDKLNIKLSDSTAAQLATHPIQYETGFTLLPGKYMIKYLARDAETGRIGTYQMSFVIPNLNKEDKRVPISSVVLSSQRVPLDESIYNVKQKIASESVNPLVLDGQKLIPSVTRVFSKSRDMYIYLQAYERDATSTQPVVAYVSFYQGQVKTFETAPLAVAQGLDAKSKAVPLRFVLPLEKLPPGQYDCQVTVLDPTGQKAAFWQAPVVVIP
jgi:VWFA-related protein